MTVPFLSGSKCSKNLPQDLFITQDETLMHLTSFLKENYSKDKVIYDPCCGTNAIGNFLRQLGYTNIIEQDLYTTDDKTDYLKKNGTIYDLMITNIPFCSKFDFFNKAFKAGKRFLLLFFTCLLFFVV